MTSARCSCIVIDPITHKTRKCKNKKWGWTRGWGWCFTKFCSVHLRKAVLTIQSFFRMKRTQKLINYFKQLPDDCWSKILYWSKYDNNVEYKYIKPMINRIGDKRVECKLEYAKIARIIRSYDPIEILMDHEELLFKADNLKFKIEIYDNIIKELFSYQNKRLLISF